MDQEQSSLKFELENVFNSDAADILAAREKARILHHGHDIRTAGDEVEFAIREFLRSKLPSLFYVGHGHVVDEQLSQSPQLDVIIANNAGAPVLFQARNGSEYFPYESVYAIGEIKSSYNNSERYIHKFSDTLRSIRTRLRRESVKPYTPFQPASLLYGNPLFSFMFFVDKGDFSIEQISDLYQTCPPGELPNIICILNKGVICNIVLDAFANDNGRLKVSLIPERNAEYKGQYVDDWILTEYGEGSSSLAACLAAFYYPLMQHLQQCQLNPPNLVEYMGHIINETSTTIISFKDQKAQGSKKASKSGQRRAVKKQ